MELNCSFAFSVAKLMLTDRKKNKPNINNMAVIEKIDATLMPLFRKTCTNACERVYFKPLIIVAVISSQSVTDYATAINSNNPLAHSVHNFLCMGNHQNSCSSAVYLVYKFHYLPCGIWIQITRRLICY